MSEPEDRSGDAGAGTDREIDQQGQGHRLAVERLLWTPTEGQDVTKSYFPLSENSDDSE